MDNKTNVASELEWTIEFHGIKYIINVISTEQMLTLEIENSETSERWGGEFTSNYIEEITHKAGNLKKFNIFTKMLQSAFNKDNESVFVDVLTFSDLEMLKARKTGQTTTTSLSTSNSNTIKQYQKRYVILTYCSEFDRVHYPLPLAFEETANVSALKRTIARLRRELVQKDQQAQEPSNEREKELRQIVSQLRQDNTELKHRLRHSSSISTAAANNSFTTGGGGNNISGMNSQTADLINSNQKLKKQVEALKKELHDLSNAYEKYRTEASKEITKWKRAIGRSQPLDQQATSGDANNNPSVFDYMNTDDKDSRNDVIIELKKQLLKVQQELRVERSKKHDIPSSSNHRSGSSNYRNSSTSFNRITGASPSSYTIRNSNSTSVNNRSYSADTAQRMRATQSLMDSRNHRYISPSNSNNNNNTNNWGRPSTATTTSRTSSRDNSPSMQARISHRYNPNSNNNQPHYREESSSSLGGRFDPTAYQRQKQEREKYAISNKAWGAGSNPHPTYTSSSSGKYRYDSPNNRESGYASANSQSSAGSRRSVRSNSSSNQSHRASLASGSEKSKTKSKKSNKKKTSKKESPLDIGIGYKNRRNENAFDSETDSEFAIEKNTNKVLMKTTSLSSRHSPSLQRNNKLDSPNNNKHDKNTTITTNNNNAPTRYNKKVGGANLSDKLKYTDNNTVTPACYSKKKNIISQTSHTTTSTDKLNEEHLNLLAEERFSKLIRGSGSTTIPTNTITNPSLTTTTTTTTTYMNDDEMQIATSTYNNNNNSTTNNQNSIVGYNRDYQDDVDDIHALRKSSDSVIFDDNNTTTDSIVARIHKNIQQKSKEFRSSNDSPSNNNTHRPGSKDIIMKRDPLDSNNGHHRQQHNPLSISKDSILRTSSNSSIHSLTPSNKSISTKQDQLQTKKKAYTQLNNIKSNNSIISLKKSIDLGNVDNDTHTILGNNNSTVVGGGLSVSSSTSSSILTRTKVSTGAPVDEDISEIDKRIQALQSYLDNARSGILGSDR